MKIKRIGQDYHDFLKANVNNDKYITNQDGFNMSMINISGDIYMFAVRYLGLNKSFKFDTIKIIPGNYSTRPKRNVCKKFGEEICNMISYGKNFFWGEWNNNNLSDNTIIFIGKLNHTTLKITPLTKYKPYIISNLKHKNIKYKYSDIRLIKIGDKYYCYDGYIRNIYNIVLTNNKILIKRNSPINHLNICPSVIKYDKNWAYWRYDKGDMVFLNWYEGNYITITKFNRKSKKCVKENFLEMKKDIIPGLGNKQLPMFSFGTPFIKINDDEWLSVGHNKIITSYPYENVKLLEFRNNIRERTDYDFVNHLSYYYCTYYILIKKIAGQYKMYISDTYLYLLPKEEYTFSINFPMGIDKYGKHIFISMGIGDYYNSIIKFDSNELTKLCIHNVEQFDISKYNYYIKK